jgi:hypothetical protein
MGYWRRTGRVSLIFGRRKTVPVRAGESGKEVSVIVRMLVTGSRKWINVATIRGPPERVGRRERSGDHQRGCLEGAAEWHKFLGFPIAASTRKGLYEGSGI